MLCSSETKGKGSAGCKYGSSCFSFSVPYSTNSVDGCKGVISQLSTCKILLLLKKSSPLLTVPLSSLCLSSFIKSYSESDVDADLTENLPTKEAQISFQRAIFLCSQQH